MTHFPIEGSIFYQTLYKQMRHGASCVMAILHDRHGGTMWT
jgi:hypothetical protein